MPTATIRARAACGLAAALLLLLAWSPAALAEPARQAVNLSLYFPVSTNQDPDITTNFRLSAIYGRVGSVRGVDLTAGVSLIQRDLRGLQFAGLYSQVDGDFGGLSMTGLVNNFAGDVTGVQYSGLLNFNEGHVTGVQFSSLFNLVQGGLSGAQFTSVFNSNSGDGGFLQVAGLANSNEGDFHGLQLGGVNFATQRLDGVQLGFANATSDLHGGQLGVINITGQAHGVQVGALNLSKRHHGTPVGLINIAEDNGGVDWVLAASNLAGFSTGVRTTVNRWYSVFSVGYGDQQGDVSESWFVNWNYGYSFDLGRAWNLGVDLGFNHIMPEKQDDPTLNDALHFALQGRVLIEARLGRTVALLAGGGFSSVYSEYSSNAKQETEPHVVAGISLF